jgi:hypothetical protein
MDLTTERRFQLASGKSSGGAGGGGKQDPRKKGNVKGGGRNKELERKLTPKKHETAIKDPLPVR